MQIKEEDESKVSSRNSIDKDYADKTKSAPAPVSPSVIAKAVIHVAQIENNNNNNEDEDEASSNESGNGLGVGRKESLRTRLSDSLCAEAANGADAFKENLVAR